jgi:hypothetical protein
MHFTNLELTLNKAWIKNKALSEFKYVKFQACNPKVHMWHNVLQKWNQPRRNVWANENLH